MRLLVLLLLLLTSPALAETVHFPSATTPPTPLQQRLAQELGTPIMPQAITELAGELHRPAGAGPHPALVALHGCGGRGPREYEDALAARFTALGYVLLIVDSFGPRGIANRCVDAASEESVDRVMDAYGGLLYLAGQPFVDPERVAAVGYSQGAMVALSAAALGGIDTLFSRHFITVIAYYPDCASVTGAVSIPTLILIGALDDWTPARNCEAMMGRRSGEGAPLRLIVYPGAYHSFNARSLRGKPRDYFGHHLEYNEAADKAAWDAMAATLRQAFGR
ncbi:MAG TPA: dienelactone hydrolase family protein [Reyranella sp.]|nr:dienelactone hydrolase family protein [Reyranella sp.]